ncbi:transaldolase B [Oceanococcus atlanticus]|uniref:transaldolase n=1 Tax=Oceanococcus atlanticus TaxID=1317117 RepID=A0A1Y1SC64_9GAMM|nr:transaldolase [Oceanococcus atlanticus]ORE86229.1 transaldolase B [Oceanococcus atlanticus]
MNALEQLGQLSTLVADSGDLDAIRRFKPTDATTNPSLILAAASTDHAATWAREALVASGGNIDRAREKLTVRFGCEILKSVGRYVSTEVDPRASFDTQKTIQAAERIIADYAAAGVGPERVLIKIASTWEGIRAARVLESRGLRCNMTLLFGFAQARQCADAGVTLISPFVGRILDWHVANGLKVESPEQDPGVQSVRRIYRWYKAHGYPTQVMGASFRNTGEILALAGCDLLTIAPKLLDELAADTSTRVEAQLSADQTSEDPREIPDEARFRAELNDDAMATEKLADGIRRFAADQAKLDSWLASLA